MRRCPARVRPARLRRCLSLLALTALGCHKEPRTADLTPIAQEEETLRKDESQLMAARGDLQRERKQIVDQRAELAQKRKAVEPGDRTESTALADQELALAKKEGDLVQKESELSKKLDELLSQRSQLIEKATGQGATAPGVAPEERAARREQQVASREKDCAKREAELAQREKDLAGREQTLAKREKETCGVAPAAVVVSKVEQPRGIKYTQRDVEPVFKKAEKTMQEHGLLTSDLPGGGKLREEIRAAMQAGDFMRAKYDADRLLEEVEGIQVNREFIQAKLSRLGGRTQGQKLDGETSKLFQEATGLYGDGKFALANQKLNRIFSMLK